MLFHGKVISKKAFSSGSISIDADKLTASINTGSLEDNKDSSAWGDFTKTTGNYYILPTAQYKAMVIRYNDSAVGIVFIKQ